MKKVYSCFFTTLAIFLTSFISAAAQPVASFSATPLSGCAPLVVNFTDNSSGNPAGWNWDLGNGTLSALKNPSTTYILPGTYTVTLTVTNAAGTNTITKTSYITVYDRPTVNFTVTDSANCIPFISSFTDVSTTNFGNIVAWEWDFDDGTVSNQQNPSHSYTQAGNFNVSLKATNDAGCFNIINKLAYIKAADPLTASFSFSQPIQCKPPETIRFTNTTQGPGNIQYRWQFGDGNTAVSSNPENTYTTGGTFSVKLIATNNIGCADTLLMNDTLTIKNNQTIIESIDTVCINKVLTLTNGSVPTALASRWIFDDGSTGFGTVLSKTWSEPGNHIVKLISNFGSCSDSTKKTITVLSPPVADFSAVDSSFCQAPAQVNFRDASDGALYFNWQFGDGDSSDVKNPAHTYTTKGDFDVRLTVTSAPGCTSSTTRYRYIRIAGPTATFDKKEGGGCIPYTFRPYVSVNSVDPVVSYLWDFGNGNTSTLQYPAEVYTDTGVYTVKLFVTTQSGCRDTVIVDSAVQTGTPPIVDFNFSATQVCPRNGINFTSLTAPATKWLWRFGDGGIDDTKNPLYEYTDSGVYSVQLIAWNKGCSDSITKNNIINVLPGMARFRPVFNCSNKREITFKDSSIAAQSWRWNFGDGTTSSLQNPVHTFNNYQTYTVSLTSSSGGCTNTDSVVVHIINDTANFTVNKNRSCPSELLSFYPVIANKQHITRYIWNFGDGTIDSTSTDTVRHRYANDGYYTVSLSVEDINGCSSVITRSDYIHVTKPTAAFILNGGGGCTNNEVQFIDSSAGNIQQWFWDFGDGNTRAYSSSQSNILHTYSNSGQYFPSLVVIDSAGCVDTAMYTLPVNISRPVADFTSPNFITCPGDRVQFQNSSIGENLTYQWNLGDNTFSTEASPVKQYNSDGDYTATLIVRDTFGCTDTVSKTNYIQVKTVTASFHTNDTIGLCIPHHAVFSNHSTNAGSYTWDFGDGGFSSTTHPNYYYSNPGTYVAKLTARRSNNCFSTDSVRIKINAPSGVLTYLPQNGCAPLQVAFTVTTADKVSFIWDFNDGTSYASNDASVNYTYSLPGNFVPRVVLKDSLGCAVPLYSTDTIRLYSTSVNFIAEDAIVCKGDMVQFRDSSFSGSPVLTRSWDFGDGSFSSDVHPLHQYTTAGNYTVKLIVTTQFGCKDSMVRTNYVQVHKKPEVSITGNDSAYCGIANIHFTGNQLNTDNGNILWNWNFGNGNNSSLQNPPQQQFDSGWHTVQLTALYNEGCADTVTASFYVRSLPVVFAGNDTTICSGTPLQLRINGNSIYNWRSSAALSCTTCDDPVVNTLNDVYVFVAAKNNEGCETTDSILVKVKKPIVLSALHDTSICAGKSAKLNISGADRYTWSPAEGLNNASISNPVVTPANTTTYKVVASDDLNCFTDSAIITINVYQQPFVYLGEDILLSAANPVTLVPVYSGDITTYRWTPSTELSCFDCATPIASPRKNTTYKVEVSNQGGCTASDEINIFVKCDNSNVSMPTAFSPNNDGKNDKFSPLGSGNIMISSFRIFNRYGQLIFVSGNFRLDDKSGGWDGKYKGQDQPTGNYVYSLEFVCGNNEVSVLNGSIMLVR